MNRVDFEVYCIKKKLLKLEWYFSERKERYRLNKRISKQEKIPLKTNGANENSL
jgi:hypothetical protein